MLRRLLNIKVISKRSFSSKNPGTYEDYFLSRKQRILNPASNNKNSSTSQKLNNILPESNEVELK